MKIKSTSFPLTSISSNIWASDDSFLLRIILKASTTNIILMLYMHKYIANCNFLKQYRYLLMSSISFTSFESHITIWKLLVSWWSIDRSKSTILRIDIFTAQDYDIQSRWNRPETVWQQFLFGMNEWSFDSYGGYFWAFHKIEFNIFVLKELQSLICIFIEYICLCFVKKVCPEDVQSLNKCMCLW